VAAWSRNKAVVGQGALWTLRSALDVPVELQRGSWYLKIPLYTKPFGLPTVSARRLNGAGSFRFIANPAFDASGKWISTQLLFSTAGCWDITGTYLASSMHFRLRVGD
jgi:hypothetical protein